MRKNKPKKQKNKRLRNLFKRFKLTHGFWPRTWIIIKILVLIAWRICLFIGAIYLGAVAIVLFILWVFLCLLAPEDEYVLVRVKKY